MILISGTFRSDSGGWGSLNKWAVKSITAQEGVKFGGWTQALFYDFQVCKTMDFSKVDTSSVYTLNNLFLNCKSLTSLDVSGWDTSHVTDMYQMFSGCSSLRSLDLSSFDTSKVTFFRDVFECCYGLSTLVLSEKFTIGIQHDMVLPNGENHRRGWRIKGDPTGKCVSGNTYNTVIATPSETTTYKWIGYFDVDWKNWDGTKLVRTEEYKAETEIHPTYKGATPTKPGSGNKIYEFSGWTDGENTCGLTDDLPCVTKDTTYTAVFTEAPLKYFVAENLSLDGDIGVNFLIDMHDAVPKNSTVTLHWYKYTEPHTVSDLKTITCNGKTYYIATARVAAKEMADTITATLTENGTVLEEITYSVKTYADKIINTENLSELSSQFASMSAEKQAQLKDLCKAMLRYGTASEKQFDDEWQHGGYHTESAIDGINYDGYVADAVPASYSMPDYSAFGLEYFASTIGTKTTTNYKVAFKAPAGSNPPTVYYNGEAIAPDTTSGTNVAIYNFNGIHAKNISDDIIVTVNETEVHFNMLAYITKAAVSGDEKLENSVKALYDYGAKAKIYFG